MIQFQSISLRNFLSVGNVTQTVRLDGTGLTLVLGANHDVGGANSRNGVGKTTILQAICYALFGEPLTRIKLDNLVNNINQKNMIVELRFRKDGTDYRIVRGRKPNVLRFFVNDKETGETDEAKGENRQTQADIDKVIRVTLPMFQQIVGLNTYAIPFLRLKAAEQREVMEELLGATTLSQRAEALKKLIQATKEAIKTEEATIKATIEANTRIETAIRRAEAESLAWATARDANLMRLAAQIEQIGEVDFEAEIAAFDALDAWIEQERALRAAAEAEGREADLLRREKGRVEAEALRYEREASAATDHQIARLEAEAARYLRDAETGTDPQIARLEAEAERCDAEAEKGIETQVARLAQQKERLVGEAMDASDRADALRAELEAVRAEIANPDGHKCSTCGQGLSGTAHFEKMKAALEAKAARIEAEMDKFSALAVKLAGDAEAIDTEVETLLADHAAQQQALRDKAAAIRAEAERAREALDLRREEWRKQAEAIGAEIEAARTALAERQAELSEKARELRTEAARLDAALAEKEVLAQEIAASVALLGPRPTTAFRSREEVWKLRETKEALLRDLEREAERENPHEGNIASLRSTLQAVDYEPLNALTLRLKHEEFLLKLLSGKDSFIRKKIVDQNLAYLNGRLHHYLEKLALPHEVRFLPDLTTEISLLGKDLDFEQLSRGEMNRVILATSWAFRDVWESLNDTVNLVFVDEMLDQGFDGAGVESAAEVLKEFSKTRGKSVFVISHRDDMIARADNILLVTKQDNFTGLEMQDAAKAA